MYHFILLLSSTFDYQLLITITKFINYHHTTYFFIRPTIDT